LADFGFGGVGVFAAVALGSEFGPQLGEIESDLQPGLSH
jgi:hypothetical protein